MKIYTKTGDSGETGLFRGPRVRKDATRIEAFGAVDELNAALGVVRTEPLPEEVDALLGKIQHHLFDLGAELATPDAAAQGMAMISDAHIQTLEAAIDRHEATLPPLTVFILPGGTRAAADLHLARTICRRAERRVVTLTGTEHGEISASLVVYLNRLSDLLFVLARAANAAAGRADVSWNKEA
jgi:cob(I)alamin adenosyltransferase